MILFEKTFREYLFIKGILKNSKSLGTLVRLCPGRPASNRGPSWQQSFKKCIETDRRQLELHTKREERWGSKSIFWTPNWLTNVHLTPRASIMLLDILTYFFFMFVTIFNNRLLLWFTALFSGVRVPTFTYCWPLLCIIFSCFHEFGPTYLYRFFKNFK